MQIIEDEVIGELRYLTVEFDQAELLAGHIGVISQGAVRRYFEGKSPDLKVKKCGGLKLDSQRNIVTMRFGIVDRPGMVLCKNDTGKTIPAGRLIALAGVDGSKIEGEKSENVGCGDRKNQAVTAVKLLNPGYDELKDERDCLIKLGERRITRIDELKQSRNHIIDELDETNKQLLELQKKYNLSVDNFSILMEEKVRLQERYDALVIAVGKDAQKFSDLLVENEKLRTALQSAQTYYENDEYGNMGRIFEQTLKEDSADLGPEGEPELADGKPDCDGGCNSCESHACDIDEVAKDATDGPISESIPTADELSEAVQEMIKNAEDEGRETLG